MKEPYRLKTPGGKYHIGNGIGGEINKSIKYSKEYIEEIMRDPPRFYMERGWKIVEIGNEGELVTVFTA